MWDLCSNAVSVIDDVTLFDVDPLTTSEGQFKLGVWLQKGAYTCVDLLSKYPLKFHHMFHHQDTYTDQNVAYVCNMNMTMTFITAISGTGLKHCLEFQLVHIWHVIHLGIGSASGGHPRLATKDILLRTSLETSPPSSSPFSLDLFSRTCYAKQ